MSSAAWGLVLACSVACIPAPPGNPDAAPQEVDPASLAPSVVTAQLADAVAGMPYGDRVLAKDGVPPYAWSVSGAAAWLSVDSNAGALRGTPPPGSAGMQVTVIVTATDRAGHSGSKGLPLKILACTPGQALACQQASAGACRAGVQTCQSDGTWAGCAAGAASTSGSGCGPACAACGPDADRCASGTQCVCGTATGPCPAGGSCCASPDGSARCANLTTDPAACGSCGTRCASPMNADPSCDAGVCGAACRAGYGACDGRTLDGCEVNLLTNPDHCGTCPTACSSTGQGSRVCDGGACDLFCNASFPQHCGLADCRAYDISNCGGCGAACANPGVNAGAPTGCAGPNACAYACNAGYGDCNAGLDGCEIDITLTPTHCGTCGNDCVAQGWDGGCVNSQCARCYQCPPNADSSRTTCCGEHCRYVAADGLYDCVACAPGSLVDGGC